MASLTADNFRKNCLVQIDGSGEGRVLDKVLENGEVCYRVAVEGTDFVAVVAENRLSTIDDTTEPTLVEQTRGDVTVTESEADTPPGPVAVHGEQTKRPVSRFVAVEDTEVDAFNHGQENKRTLSKTVYDVRLLTQFLTEQGDNRALESIPAEEL